MDELNPTPLFLDGVPKQHILNRLAAAGGKEVESGKFASTESSAALAVNCFGWFIPRPELLPSLPGLEHAFPAELVDVEYQARFPWAGGRHPWLDAVIVTQSHLIGVESKRFEPFRDKKTVSLSTAYDRDVWGDRMTRYCALRDQLRAGDVRFVHLDAAQLVKHAYGLVTDAKRKGKRPALVYIFAEPGQIGGRAIGQAEHERHREEIYPAAFLPKDDKITRLHAQSARIEAGHVWFPDQASWLEELRLEFATFPYGRHDDQVDSVSQFLAWVFERKGRQMHCIKLGGI